ncbi:MAG: lipoate--protein ligase family protein [Actinobacteria bacterium]|nr:lipoate--protein ligase family protein [Actinomycetota bacterium]
MTTTWRLVDDLDAELDAAGQMAADRALLDEVAAGASPALRLYRWSPPALSLGRFQPEDDVDHTACRDRGVEIVRRPTGGRALLHGADLTYAVAMPRPERAASVDAVYRLLARGLTRGLACLGVEAAVARADGPAGPLCFASQQGADLRVGEQKVCGSAQVRRDDAVLQHGALLLDRLPFDETDLLRGAADDDGRARLRVATVTLRELGAPVDARVVANALADGFAEALDLRFTAAVRG